MNPVVADEDRVDVARARHWSVSIAGHWTIVVATNTAEARLLGVMWVAVAHGRTTIDLRSSARVRPAGADDVERWLAIRRQEHAGVGKTR